MAGRSAGIRTLSRDKLIDLIDKHFPLGLKSHSDSNPSLFAAQTKPSRVPLSNSRVPFLFSRLPPRCLEVFCLLAIFLDCNQQAFLPPLLALLVLLKDCIRSRQSWPPTVIAARAHSQHPRQATIHLSPGEVARDRTEDTLTAQATMQRSPPPQRRPPNKHRRQSAHRLSPRRLRPHLLPLLPLPTRQASRDLTTLHNTRSILHCSRPSPKISSSSI